MEPVIGRRHGVTVPVRVDPRGLLGPTRRQAAGGDWRRTSRGYYVPAHIEPTPGQRIAEVGVLLRSERIAVTGWAASWWRGDRWANGTRPDGSTVPVDLTSTHALLRPQPPFRLSHERVDPRSFEVVDGLRLACAASAVCFAMRHASGLEAAVEMLDMAYHADLVTPEEIGAWLGEHPWHRGHDQAVAALALGDENSWSPQESHVRLTWQRTTGRRPLANRPVFDLAGRHVGTPDLVDPVTGVLGEYDGDVHLTRSARRRDLEREQSFREVGLEPFTVLAGDLRSGRFVDCLRMAEARASERVAEPRWTLQPPDWWVSTHTVARRRALEGIDREIWWRGRG